MKKSSMIKEAGCKTSFWQTVLWTPALLSALTQRYSCWPTVDFTYDWSNNRPQLPVEIYRYSLTGLQVSLLDGASDIFTANADNIIMCSLTASEIR